MSMHRFFFISIVVMSLGTYAPSMKNLSDSFNTITINNKTDVQKYDPEKTKALLQECNQGERALIEVIISLLENKADPNGTESFWANKSVGGTPLYESCKYTTPSFQAIKLLLEKKADPNIQHKENGFTPLHCVTRYGPYHTQRSIQTIKLLLAGNADPHLQDSHGNTSLHNICSNFDPSIEALLLLMLSLINQKMSDIPNMLKRLCNNNESFKKMIYTYLLYVKRLNQKTGLKIPKFINFEIFKPLIQVEVVRQFLRTKNNDNKTACMMALEKKTIRS